MICQNDFQAQWQRVRAKAVASLERVGSSGWLVLGQEVRSFERALAEFWGLPHSIGCGNGLDAIEISLRCLGLKPGQKVLTTPLSAFATTLAVLRAGGIPLFVDVDETGSMNLDEAEKVLREDRDIRFLLPVHLYGHPMDLVRLESIRDRFGLLIVEDCAQAIGACMAGRPVGVVGQMVATSFYPTKNLGSMGDGGAILTADAPLAEKARRLRDYGQSEKYVHSEYGLNSRLDELQAAILRDALLPMVEAGNHRRMEIARRYQEGIRHPRLSLLPVRKESKPVWHLFPVLIEGGHRADFISHAQTKGIQMGVHYPRLITEQEGLLQSGKPRVYGPLMNARRFAESEVSLPIHPYLSDEDVDQVIGCCNGWGS